MLFLHYFILLNLYDKHVLMEIFHLQMEIRVRIVSLFLPPSVIMKHYYEFEYHRHMLIRINE